MASAKSKKKKAAIKPKQIEVVFDTSAVHVHSASELVNSNIQETIRANSEHVDLSISWYLPEIVALERTFQMEVNTGIFEIF